MKILNLDKIGTTSIRTLVIGEVKHPILPMSVDNFIQTTQQIEALQKDNGSYTDQIKSTVDMILRSVPSLTREQLVERSLEELEMIATFVRGEDIDGQEEEAEGEQEGK